MQDRKRDTDIQNRLLDSMIILNHLERKGLLPERQIDKHNKIRLILNIQFILLRVPWIARSSSQSILKEINPEYSLEETDAEAETPTLWPLDMKN